MAEKKYVIDNAELMAEWNWEKNNELKLGPKTLTIGNNKKAWWKCSKGHEWQASVVNRNKGSGCPYCLGRYAIKGENDLKTVNPTLANEWNYEKNGSLKPEHFTVNSQKKVWWKCQKGHEWQTTISHRTNGSGCPYCAGQKVIKGENDLQTVNPILANEWNYEKNKGLTPEDVMPNSNKKVWWKCQKGHEWQTSIANRNYGYGCPVCNSERHTSFPEYAILYYLKECGLEVIHSYKEKGYELDIYIPSKRIAIEYDGSFWHQNKIKKDLEKNFKCEKDGIKLFRIREGLPPLNDSSIDYVVQEAKKDLSQILRKVLSDIIGKIVDIDLTRDAIAIENLREFTEKENSLLFSNPEIAKEWNYEKNGKLKPEHFSANSNKKVWWKCSKGHEWQARINSRNSGNGCPYCTGLYVIKGENDLQTINPALSKEWHYEKNNGLTPSDVMPNSDKKVWWKCSKGHEWEATIINRNKGTGCPYCASQKILRGYNDLQTVNPDLAKEWNYNKNFGLTPMDVMPNSGKKVWWKCANGHEWQATIAHRNDGSDCPYCSGRYVITGENDLKTINPDLANEWNYKRNGGLKPAHFLANSHEKVWWKCSSGHEWQATIDSRNTGRGCPYCASQKILKGYNDLLTINPTLAKEWNHEKNDKLTPSDVMPNSNKKVWWKCSNGHEWQAMVSSRNKGACCPYCSGRNAIKGENDLQTVNPTLAKEWNYEKNNGLTPMDVLPNSGKNVWWKCSEGHEWQARIADRNKGRGCPICRKTKNGRY
ncbi:MAG: hypothetical protein II317_04565 [Clostridia bacterium]|nr:hypothetical protein [Clostridia bacterium]